MKSLFPRVLLASAVGVLVCSCASVAQRPAGRPNVVVIVADDMGFSDAGCYGGEIKTPTLDKLAAGGLRFTQFYNTARCWPTRASILTGYYPQQMNRDSLPGMKKGGAQGTRPEWAKLLPEMLKTYGYRSYHSGKWHVDGKVLDGGFDHSYSLDDHDRYFSPKNHKLDDKPLPEVGENEGYYATTAIANHSIEMLSDHAQNFADKPFFLYLAFIAPHFPLHALPQDIAVYKGRYEMGWDDIRDERYARIRTMGLLNCALSPAQPDVYAAWSLPEENLRAAIGPGEMGRYAPWPSLNDAQKKFQPQKMAVHAAMIHRMDIEIGRVVDQLKKMNVYSNTAIFFVSDNGATSEQIIRGEKHDPAAPLGSAHTFLSLGPGWSTAANTPFRYHKSWVHEGGISTPCIVHWPAGITAHGALRSNPGHVVDIPPTVLDLASEGKDSPHRTAGAPPMSGRSLVPAFTEDGSVDHDYLWWCHDGNRAIRIGDWKLVADHKKPWELYNLAKDRSEMHDLAAENPGKAAELEKAWQARAEEFLAQSGGVGTSPKARARVPTVGN